MRKFLFLLFISGGAFAQQAKEVTLESIFKEGRFIQRPLSGLSSMKDGKSYVSVVREAGSNIRQVIKSDYSNAKIIRSLYSEKDVIYKGDTLPLSTNFSDDESKVLLETAKETIYRHSTRANYFVFNLQSKQLTPLSDKGKQSFPAFSPDGNKVAYVRQNNIFIKDLNTGLERQVTADGKFNQIINGQSDWVYEEEFSFAKAFFWSPDSKKIAYYKFDETDVREYSMTVYDSLYPTEYRYKYPKAGQKNSVVSIHIYNLENNSTKDADTGTDKDQYIPGIKWTTDPDLLCILRMNRLQNKLEYLLTEAGSGKSKVILTEQDKAYIKVQSAQLTFLSDRKRFINVSERDGFNHIYLYGMDGRILSQLTKGNWEVTGIYGLDEKNNRIYYQSAERSPLKRDVYSVDLSGSGKKRLSTLDGSNSATFSNDFRYLILNNSSSVSPSRITLNDNTGKLIRTLEDNSEVKKAFSESGFRNTEFFSFKTSEGIELNGSMIKPANFDPSEKYPVLMYVYGGPGSQIVTDSWGSSRTMWFHYLARKGYLVVCVDNRGTGYRGAAFKKVTYKELGKYETIDQIEAAKWLAGQKFVDPARIGIWGWSYGGYMSSLCITKGADIFSMAIAVAPVTTWRFYDSIYTERYMRTPQENPSGYDDNSPVNYAGLLKGKFLLVHGTGDDNVHFQNSVVFSEALIKANKKFEQAYYPDKNHSISGGSTSIHLYSKLTDFILHNL